jgi:hypothetical protein
MDEYIHLRKEVRDVFEMRYYEIIDPDKDSGSFVRGLGSAESSGSPFSIVRCRIAANSLQRGQVFQRPSRIKCGKF